jgi:signal transduction histidine kinase/CheY-like chemotaxis protein
MAGLAAAYFVTGELSLLLAVPPGYASAFWPPAGIAVASLFLGGYRLWPGVLAGSIAVNSSTWFDPSGGWISVGSGLAALAISVAATMQALGGAYLARRYVAETLELVHEKEIAKFYVLTGPLSCLLGATISVPSLVAAGLLEPGEAAYNWWAWWIGDSIGVAVLAPLVFIATAKPREIWKRRRVTVGAPLFVLLALTVTVFFWVNRLEAARIRSAFEERADSVTREVEVNLGKALNGVAALGSLYGATPEANRHAAFTDFARSILQNNDAIWGVSWNPRVTASERAAFEERARAAGYAGFEITDRKPDRTFVRAADRAEFVPVLHAEPDEQHGLARGYDLAVEPSRARTIRTACETGQPTATTLIPLVQRSGTEPGILIFMPVYRGEALPPSALDRCAAASGYVAGMIRVSDLIRPARDSGARGSQTAARLEIEFLEASIADTQDPSAHVVDIDASSGGLLRHAARIEAVGRVWAVVVRSDMAYGFYTGAWRPWVALALGMLFCALVGAFMLVVTGKTVIMERMGAERAAALSAANDKLQMEIAERQQAEAALIENESHLRQAQKMEAVGRLAGGVAHDFNNLLTAILGFSTLILDQLTPNDPMRQDVEEIQKAGESAASLTRQLLAFSRKQLLQPQVLDLNAVVTRMESLLRRVIGEPVMLVPRLTPRLERIAADPGQLEQIIMNLAINARDAMPDGGTLTVETGNVEVDAAFRATYPGSGPGPYVMLAFADTGIGMDEETRARIFEPFFTTKKRGEGTGLGLSTVYGIVRQSEGYVSVETAPGRGTTLKIYLPAIKSASDVTPAPVAVRSARGTETILLVEDQTEVRAVARAALMRHGYRVLEASGGEEALGIVARHGRDIDLLLTDVVMPAMSGPELAAQIHQRYPDLRVLYASGYTDDAMGRHGVLDADVAFIQKPFTPQQLLRKVRDILQAQEPRVT